MQKTLSKRQQTQKQNKKGHSRTIDELNLPETKENSFKKSSLLSSAASNKTNQRRWLMVVLCISFVFIYRLYLFLFPQWKEVTVSRSVQTPEEMTHHCQAYVGDARIEEIVKDRVYLAIGYDLANTILIKTSEGHIVVDVSMNPKRAKTVREELEAKAGKDFIHTIIYTHSHVDHVGGAGQWVDKEYDADRIIDTVADGTETETVTSRKTTNIWATDSVVGHFFKQYGAFREAESLRASRQFGHDIEITELPCNAIGARSDIETTVRDMDFRLPTHTFSGFTSFSVGEYTIELHEAHGETHDMLFVYIPELELLLPGDNYYQSFPNLYTIRGSSPRPVRDWIRSLDAMRKLNPKYLVPSHTIPITGKEEILKKLTDYRDGIQWIYTSVIRAANEGKTLEEMTESIGLPEHLVGQEALAEFYGQIDWSVKAIYTNELGWFDGHASHLYSEDHASSARRYINHMGGVQHILTMIQESLQKDDKEDYVWALDLIDLLQDGILKAKVLNAKDKSSSLSLTKAEENQLKNLEIKALQLLGEKVTNMNGRGYLLQVAKELAGQVPEHAVPNLKLELVAKLPLDLIFEVMISRLQPELSQDAYETVCMILSGTKYFLTVRKGVLEVQKDTLLPGNPEPMGTLVADEVVFKQIALKKIDPTEAVATGKAQIQGDPLKYFKFQKRFKAGA